MDIAKRCPFVEKGTLEVAQKKTPEEVFLAPEEKLCEEVNTIEEDLAVGSVFQLHVIDLDNFNAPGMPPPLCIGHNLYMAMEPLTYSLPKSLRDLKLDVVRQARSFSRSAAVETR